MTNIIVIDLNYYNLTKDQLANFATEYYATEVTSSNFVSGTYEFSFDSNKLLEEFKKTLDSTYKIAKK